MGVSLTEKRRVRALRKRYLDKKGFLPTLFGAPGPVVKKVAKPHDYPQQENQQLHATYEHYAALARLQERLMDRARWSRG